MRHPASMDNYSLRHSVLTSQQIRDRGSPPQYVMPMDTHDAPLNLSLTSTTLPSSTSAFTPQVSRPSVITCASTVDKGHRYGNSSPSAHSLPSPSRREVLTGTIVLKCVVKMWYIDNFLFLMHTNISFMNNDLLSYCN